jgi:dihydroorotate dehydrogenase electron transfer subunit
MTAVKIIDVVKESPTARTLTFEFPYRAWPGQFVMVWIPGVDEIPMSLSRVDRDLKAITVENVGEATAALHALKPGARLGVRGPYGSGYVLPRKKRYLLVAGGSGAASLAPVLDVAPRLGSKAAAVLGAKTASKLIFEKRLRGAAESLAVTTDDGSSGCKGFATKAAEHMLDEEDFDLVLTCGPEAMMAKVVELARERKVPVQASLERYMKCGLGVCGSCAFGGLRVCADGPVFDGKVLAKNPDFGRSKLAPDGRRVKL